MKSLPIPLQRVVTSILLIDMFVTGIIQFLPFKVEIICRSVRENIARKPDGHCKFLENIEDHN